ncbi:actin depolymerizing protein [Hysterangium stoloniferum]|nr:actin depolymerizing protein [Hysterangium stoloniferum]
MSATSGIPIHSDLQRAFATAQQQSNNLTRFLKLAIRDEFIVLDSELQANAETLAEDLEQLQPILDDTTPAYILARLDDPSSQWLAITYVPDTANVRDKMLYASTRTMLTRSLGAAAFPSTLFATSKTDLTPRAYTAHLAHLAAPPPRSVQEQEMESVRVAERSNVATKPTGSFAGAGVSVAWPEEVKAAVRSLAGEQAGQKLVVLSIDEGEILKVLFDGKCPSAEVKDKLPQSDPGIILPINIEPDFQRLFIYTCPANSLIKHRMLYSSGSSSVLSNAKALGLSIARKVETSDPAEISEKWIRDELGLGTETGEERAFKKPRGPTRRQR